MNSLDESITIVRSGGILIFPTDTAFGIGCRIDRADSIEKLYRIRKRPIMQAMPVLADSQKMAVLYYRQPVPQKIIQLMVRFWPGALTIVYYADEDKVPLIVRGGTKTIGIRVPDNDRIRTVIRSVGVPVLGPSANFHSEPTPYRFTELNPNLIKLSDAVLIGECKTGKASTVIDCTEEPFKIIRQGALPENLVLNSLL